MEHVGSAHDEQELEAPKTAAAQRLADSGSRSIRLDEFGEFRRVATRCLRCDQRQSTTRVVYKIGNGPLSCSRNLDRLALDWMLAGL
jgi:hypothetical protein